MKYVVRDEETGNYVSSDSVMVYCKELWYSTHTGRADGLEYHNTYDGAEKILHKINTLLEKHNIHKTLKVIEVIKEKMNWGELNKVILQN